MKIDSVNNYYVIYAKQGQQNYKLISKKNKYECEDRLTIGKKYYLKTESILRLKLTTTVTLKKLVIILILIV